MANINENEIECINNFLEKFSPSVVKIFSQSLDAEIFKSFEFVIESSKSIKSASLLKENNIIYEHDYVRGASASSMAVLIPEEFIADITDVIMGGAGENAYKGSLSELEINAFSELLPKIFKDIEKKFQKAYEVNLAFDADPIFLSKTNVPEYEDKFSDPAYNFAVTYILKINSVKEYKVHLLLKITDVKQILSDYKLIQASNLPKSMHADAIGFEHLSDIKIDITAELGRSRVPIKYALELVKGSMVELDTLNDSDIKVFANGIEVAKAQIVVVGENFGLRITKIVAPEERIKYI